MERLDDLNLAKLVRERQQLARLTGMPDCYKIKLRDAGYRLAYQVVDARVVVVVIAVGKRENDLAGWSVFDRECLRN